MEIQAALFTGDHSFFSTIAKCSPLALGSLVTMPDLVSVDSEMKSHDHVLWHNV